MFWQFKTYSCLITKHTWLMVFSIWALRGHKGNFVCFLTSVFSLSMLACEMLDVSSWVFSISVLHQSFQWSKWEYNSEGVRSKLWSDFHYIFLGVTLSSMALLSLYNLRFSTKHCLNFEILQTQKENLSFPIVIVWVGKNNIYK